MESVINDAVNNFIEKRPIYESLTKTVESIIKDVLNIEGINYYDVNGRTKSIDSYRNKALKGKYKDPKSEIMDMSGIRIITYTDTDAKMVYSIISNIFNVYPEYTIDKSEELGVDRVGYRSFHCVGDLGIERTKLREYASFDGLCFEIQIRTILQHAWAEFEHDRNYKFSGVLPTNIRRRLSILAGILELTDKEFDNISHDIDAYIEEVIEKTEIGDLSIEITTQSLIEYLNKKFEEIPFSRNHFYVDSEIITEIIDMNINTIEELDNIVPEDYVDKRNKYKPEENTYAGIVRDLLMIYDANYYFENSWNDNWYGIDSTDSDFLINEYNVDLNSLNKRYKFGLRFDIDIE